MAVAAPSFTGFRPEAIQFLADLAANNERAWFQPRKAEYERLLKEPMEELCVALEAAVPRRADIPLHADPARSPVPDLPRHALLEGQVAVQDARRGELRLGRRRRSTPRRADRTPRASMRAAATSTSSRARSTSAAASGTRTRRGSTAFRERVADDSTASATSSRRRRSRTTFGDGRRRRRVAQARPGRLSRRTTRRRTSCG